jgi:adenylate cyclase
MMQRFLSGWMTSLRPRLHAMAGVIARHGVLAGFIALLCAAGLLASSPLPEQLSLMQFDTQSRILATHFPITPANEVVIVGIDEASLARFPEPLALWHPYLGQFLSGMALARPRVLGLDIVLPDRSFDAIIPGHDRLLSEGLLAARRSIPLVLGVSVDDSGRPRRIYPPFVALAGREAWAYALLTSERDHIVRSAAGPVDNGGLPTLAGQMAHLAGVPFQAGWINYALMPAPRYIPFHEVIDALARHDDSALQTAFAGKAVLLGSVLRFEDRHQQPVNLARWEQDNGAIVPGVLIHAQLLASALNERLIARTPALWVWLGAFAAALLWFAALRLRYALALAAVLLLGAYGVTIALLHRSVFFPAGAPVLVAMLAIGGRWMFDAILQMRERRRLRNTFSGYVSPQVMDEILAGRLTESMEGETRTVCVMFADIRGFTTLSENIPPDQVIALLNRYFEVITQAIHDENGTLNCIMGDGIMAIFGAPKTMQAPATHAFAAARKIMQQLPRLNRELEAEGKQALSIGIGLNLGPAIVGNVGSRARHDYSAIGDTTNVAARLEGMTKVFGVPLVCSPRVAEALGMPVGMIDLGTHPIKGRSAMQLYGWQEPPSVCGSMP